MVKLTNMNPIQDRIEGGKIKLEKRPYLGMSQIGHECRNYLWLSFRWAYDSFITPRIKRIFERGDLEEPRIIADLKGIGAEVYMLKDGKKIPATGVRGEYQEEIVHHTGHAKGHIDSRIINLPGCEKTEHLGEYKTMKNSAFNEVIKKGVKEVYPAYWGQMHCYMGYLKLKRALFVATNKDNEERLYLRVPFDKQYFDRLQTKILDIVSSDKPMEKLSKAPDFFKCRWCNAKNVCHAYEKPSKNCRTCVNGTIEDGGVWSCGGHVIPIDVQRVGCDQYSPLF